MGYTVWTSEGRDKLEYALYEGRKVKLRGSISKYWPGWKRAWEETLAVLHEMKQELDEDGTGRRSRSFRQSSS